MVIPIVVTALWIVFLPIMGNAQPEGFPFVGEITADKVNIRAGQNTNFEKLGQLSKGDDVLVLGQEYTWYKIKLPQHSNSYIISKYVQRLDEKAGIVTAGNVNIRAWTDVNATSLGQVSQGTKLAILEEKDGWLKIVPFEDFAGWVSKEFISFKSKDISKYREKSLTDSGELPEVAQKPLEKIVDVVQLVSVEGILEPLPVEISRDLRYRLMVDGQPAYIVGGISLPMDFLANSRVKIDGILAGDQNGPGALALLTIIKIQLIL